MRSDRLVMYQFEMKWRNPPEPGTPPPSPMLSVPPTMGIQTGASWSKLAIDRFIDSETVSAQAAKNQLRMFIPMKLGRPPGTRWTNEELRRYLQRTIRYSERIVVVPGHVDLRQLWLQLADLYRQDKRPSRAYIARLP